MTYMSSKGFIQDFLTTADITINGTRPWDIQVHNEKLYDKVLAKGSLGLGEAYMDGWWDAIELDQFFVHLMSAKIPSRFMYNPVLVWTALKARITNLQLTRAFEVGEKHYDAGNDLYKAMLDRRMTYTCGYWKDANTLDEAQEAKLDLVCRKIGLKPGQNILDIGSGWGSFLNFAGEKYDARGIGVSVSKEQVAYANSVRVSDKVESRLMDYHDVQGTFDHVVSIGMFEHVGYKNYRSYMQKVYDVLSDDGYFLLHTIGSYVTTTHADPWIDKYIFPNGMLPSIAQIGTAIEKLFIMEDWHNFGPYYDLTLMQWFKNFDTHWPELRDKYDDRFYRMWKYYLLSCAGGFRCGQIELWQIVLSKHGTIGGYQSIR
ncbi:MAG: Cyclopropane-fatty-acyl-phospholipid synthase [Candidatus Kaiserbacteria bacterium]|nr:Cyclopropane-fatty-acyl-phospholipid synthase [Candidatus Kaiserbacteria bacterium]